MWACGRWHHSGGEEEPGKGEREELVYGLRESSGFFNIGSHLQVSRCGLDLKKLRKDLFFFFFKNLKNFQKVPFSPSN